MTKSHLELVKSGCNSRASCRGPKPEKNFKVDLHMGRKGPDFNIGYIFFLFGFFVDLGEHISTKAFVIPYVVLGSTIARIPTSKQMEAPKSGTFQFSTNQCAVRNTKMSRGLEC